jgi:hypothetical protein
LGKKNATEILIIIFYIFNLGSFATGGQERRSKERRSKEK